MKKIKLTDDNKASIALIGGLTCLFTFVMTQDPHEIPQKQAHIFKINGNDTTTVHNAIFSNPHEVRNGKALRVPELGKLFRKINGYDWTITDIPNKVAKASSIPLNTTFDSDKSSEHALINSEYEEEQTYNYLESSPKELSTPN